MYYSRWQKTQIEEALNTRRVVILEGPRQSGKSTLAESFAKNHGNLNNRYLTLDNPSLHASALKDPISFVQKPLDELLVIDEIQKAPALLSAIKKNVDENPRKFGQYLLTGSADIQSAPAVTESLAGRISKISLRTLSQGEIEGTAPNFLQNAFSQNFPEPQHAFNRDDILNFALRGGYPEALTLSEKQRISWHQDYIDALISRDLKDIANIRRLDSMEQLIQITAAWSSQFIDLSNIGRGLAIQRETLEIYLNALEALYLTEKVQPWTKTDYDRVGKRSKVFMTDSGLMSSLLKWRFDAIRLDGDKIGKLIETYVFNELSAQISTDPHEHSLLHYRDRQQREIDFLIERADGALLGLEVKASSTVGQEDFRHLYWFQKNIAPKSPIENLFIGLVLYTGEHVLPFGKNCWAVPISQFWPKLPHSQQ